MLRRLPEDGKKTRVSFAFDHGTPGRHLKNQARRGTNSALKAFLDPKTDLAHMKVLPNLSFESTCALSATGINLVAHYDKGED